MSLLLHLAFASALAADPAEIAYAEVDATAVIESCRYGCDRTARELAEAFVIRATAAAVLRGEIDTQAAANARFLAPDLAADWDALLPGSDGAAPEAWVRDWGKQQPQTARPPLMPMPASPRAAREPAPEPSPSRPPRVDGRPPLELRAETPDHARLGVTAAPEVGAMEASMDADVRAQIAAPVALIVGGSLAYDRVPLPDEVGELVGTDVDAIAGRTGAVRLGIGPRWSQSDGREVLIYGAVQATMGATTWATWTALEDDHIVGLPAAVGLGAAVGAIAIQPLGGRTALEIDGAVEHLDRVALARYLDSRRAMRAGGIGVEELADPAERDAAVSDRLRARVDVDLRWRPAPESGVAILVGAGARLDQRTGERPEGVPRTGPDLAFTPALGAAWTF